MELKIHEKENEVTEEWNGKQNIGIRKKMKEMHEISLRELRYVKRIKNQHNIKISKINK